MSTPRVLLVNDCPATNAIHAEIVRMRGYGASLVSDGAQAVAACVEDPPDAVVMNIQMPVMDGLAAATEIAKLHQAGAVPYVAIVGTSAAMDSDLAKSCRAAGMIAVHGKPVDFESLGRSIDSAIRFTRLRRAAPK